MPNSTPALSSAEVRVAPLAIALNVPPVFLNRRTLLTAAAGLTLMVAAALAGALGQGTVLIRARSARSLAPLMTVSAASLQAAS
jgi:hypothetical protein